MWIFIPVAFVGGLFVGAKHHDKIEAFMDKVKGKTKGK